jgi:hypothetical protein
VFSGMVDEWAPEEIRKKVAANKNLFVYIIITVFFIIINIMCVINNRNMKWNDSSGVQM